MSEISIDQLHPHPLSPFGIRDDPSMMELVESVKQFGVLVPAIARPREDGSYELIAGHRRQKACELAGLDSMPVIVMNLDDNDAIIQLVDSNIQRENILPSERAKAYKLKMDALKRQGARSDLTFSKISAKFRSDDSVGDEAGVSGDTVRNYIALNNLIPELMEMVDEKKIALSPAYQIAALPKESQEQLLDTIESEQATPSLSQAQCQRIAARCWKTRVTVAVAHSMLIAIFHIHKYKVPFHALGSGYYDSINREHKINDALRVIAFLFHI